jgi:thioredoxin-like negative regulator of GroEL
MMRSIVLSLLLAAWAGPIAFSAVEFRTSEKGVMASAKKKNKPVMMYFYGIWCPPCNELKELVYTHPDFLKKAGEFELLKVDVDKQASWPLKDRFQVNGYPTLIFTNPQGKVIYRFSGYRSPKEFVRAMDYVLAAKGQDLETSCKRTDEESLWNCAFVCSENKDHACAKAAYEKLQGKLVKGTARYELAQSYFADNAETPELKRDAYARLIEENPSSPQALIWALGYWETFSDDAGARPKRSVLGRVIANWETMKKDPRAEELGLSPTDMAQLRAEVIEHVAEDEDAKKAWKEAADLLEATAATVPKGTIARGFTIERIGCLEAAGELDRALALAQEYRRKFPEEFTFHYQTASMLNRAKRYNEALPIAQKAFDVSYGDNKVRAAILLVKIYETIPNKTAAKSVYDRVIAEIKPDAKLQVRTHRYLKALKEEFEKL